MAGRRLWIIFCRTEYGVSLTSVIFTLPLYFKREHRFFEAYHHSGDSHFHRREGP